LAVTTEASYLGEVKAKLVLQPMNSISRTASEDTD